MSDKNSASQNHFKKVASGLLVLTGFVSFASNSGLANQLASNLDQFLIPAAQAKDVGKHHIGIADKLLNQKLGANSLIVEDKTAFVVNQVGEKTAAPSGYYKLSDGSILKVKDGEITNIGNSQLNLEENENYTLQATKWRDIIDRWKQADKQEDSLGNLQQVTKQNVQETLDRIIES